MVDVLVVATGQLVDDRFARQGYPGDTAGRSAQFDDAHEGRIGDVKGQPPHITGADFLKRFGIPAKSAAAYALTDQDYEALAKATAGWPRVRVIQSGRNGGFGAGNNHGIRAGLPLVATTTILGRAANAQRIRLGQTVNWGNCRASSSAKCSTPGLSVA